MNPQSPQCTSKMFHDWTTRKCLKNVLLSAVLLALCACKTVEPPKRPVAYLYPAVEPMSIMNKCTPREISPDGIRNALKEARALEILEKAGLQESEIALMARGISGKGYAELDARRTAKCPIQRLSMAVIGGKVTIRCIYGKEPPEFNRFGLVLKRVTPVVERGHYGEMRTVASVTEGGVTLKHVDTRGKRHWEVIVEKE